jgi:hypothetical protein
MYKERDRREIGKGRREIGRERERERERDREGEGVRKTERESGGEMYLSQLASLLLAEFPICDKVFSQFLFITSTGMKRVMEHWDHLQNQDHSALEDNLELKGWLSGN